MLQNLKYFLKHSVIYSISNVATKAIGVVLLPLYSSFLSLAEFGVLGILEVTISIFAEVVNLGLGPALVMLNNIKENEGRKKEILFTIFSTSLIICLSFLIIGLLIIPYVSSSFGDPEKFKLYFRLGLFVIVLRVLNNIFTDKLRAEERSVLFTIINLLKLVITLSLTIYFVAFLKIGVLGVLYSYVISESITFILLLPFLFPQMRFHFDKNIFSSSLGFGVPLIFSSIAMMVLNVSDRYILKYFSDYSVVGLYDLGYRVAGVMNMFFIMPISLTLMPIAYKVYNTDGDKRYFSKLMTYLTFLLVWAGLALSLYSKELIKIFALNPAYWPAYQVVPVVVFSYVVFGMRLVSSLGMFLTKNTKHVAYITIMAAIVNIALNFWLIPKYGMMAAAYTTLAAFIVLYFLSDYFSSKYFKIPFENIKLLKVISLGVLFYLLSLLFNSNVAINILLKLILILLFPIVLYGLKFYEKIELERIRGLYFKWKNPRLWKNNLKSEFKN